MNILGITSYNSSSINFRTNYRSVYAGNSLVRRNTTCFFRPDLDWNKFAVLLQKKYESVPRVNIFNCACSDGSESWSLAALIKNMDKVSAQKYFPIHASDIDREMIASARSMICNADDSDLFAINQVLKKPYSEYFTPQKSNTLEFPIALKPKDDLTPAVKFKRADIFHILEKLPPQNNVLLCRNFWAYIELEDREKLAKKLAEKFDNTSLIVLGSLEKGWDCDALLRDYGFVETTVEHVFTKPSPKNEYNPGSINYYDLLREKLFSKKQNKKEGA